MQPTFLGPLLVGVSNRVESNLAFHIRCIVSRGYFGNEYWTFSSQHVVTNELGVRQCIRTHDTHCALRTFGVHTLHGIGD